MCVGAHLNRSALVCVYRSTSEERVGAHREASPESANPYSFCRYDRGWPGRHREEDGTVPEAGITWPRICRIAASGDGYPHCRPPCPDAVREMRLVASTLGEQVFDYVIRNKRKEMVTACDRNLSNSEGCSPVTPDDLRVYLSFLDARRALSFPGGTPAGQSWSRGSTSASADPDQALLQAVRARGGPGASIARAR